MSYEQYRPQGFSFLPPVVKNLLIINGLFFLATLALENAFHIKLADYLGLHYFESQKFSPYQFITYMFMHADVAHILSNMFVLWMFGYILENVWGGKRFLIYYLITGVGAALFHYAIFYFQINPDIVMMDKIIADPTINNINSFISQHAFHVGKNSGLIYSEFQQFGKNLDLLNRNPENIATLEAVKGFIIDYRIYYLNLPNIVGASGAVFGILLAFGMLFPNTLIYIYFLFPIKAKWLVILYGVLELYLGFTNTDSNVAHFAHLGGMFFGFFLIKYWKSKGIY
jgi:membrane associated rhomboid family serine protease